MERKALEYDPRNPGGKILIGAFGPKLVGIDDNRHVLTVAGSRAGKSVTLINNLLFYRGSVIATDSKCELANITAARRAALGQKVHVLDPFESASPRIAHLRKSYNPMAVLRIDSPTIVEDAGLIADALVVRTGHEKDPHWDESAKNFIEGIILHVATHSRYGGRRNLLTVRDLIRTALKKEPTALIDDDQYPLYELEKEMLQNAGYLAKIPATEDLAGALEGAARDFYDKADNEGAGVLSSVRRHTKFLDYSAMRRVLGGHDFDLTDLKRDRNGVSVYLCLPASRMGLCNRWLRIFINQLLDAMEREKTTPPAPVLVCLDEFPILGYMRQLEDSIAQIASFHCKLWVVLQDWSQGRRFTTSAGKPSPAMPASSSFSATTIWRRLNMSPVASARPGSRSPARARSVRNRRRRDCRGVIPAWNCMTC